MEPNKKFKELRKKLMLSQTDFAEKLGVSQGTIGDIERGRIGISKNVKSKIIEKFNIEAGYFDDSGKSKNIEIRQGDETGLRQGLLSEMEVKELQERAKNRIHNLRNPKKKHVNTENLTDQEILQINSQKEGSYVIHNLSNERLENLTKLLKKQQVIAEKVINTLVMENYDYKNFRNDILAIQSFENVLDNLINCSEINELIKIKDSARHYPNMSFSDFKTAVSADFDNIKPYLKIFSALAKSLKAFVDKAQHIPEEITGIDINEYKEYIELNAEIEAKRPFQASDQVKS